MNVRLALVTGASRGMGKAAAMRLAGAGYHVIAVARTVGALEELSDEIQAGGGEVSMACLDLADDNALDGMFRSLGQRWSVIDLVIHAAIHAPPLSPAHQIDGSEFDRALQLNVRATARLMERTAPLMKAGSTFVFLDDPQGTGKFFAAYGASKAAQMALARCWQRECQRTGPRIMIFQPRRMKTRTLLRFHPGISADELSTPEAEVDRLMKILDCVDT